ncbi:MAG: integrin [Acidobacteria bacterium]|nr:integrin [Acidobacteriota bacterium]
MIRGPRVGLSAVVALGVSAAAISCARTESQPAPSSSVPQVRQVAYLKASNPDMGDHFACGGSLPGHIGSALAVSADGNTMVVGAPHESSNARGINGNAADNSLYNSGAVYVFVRRNGAWVQQAYVKASNAGQSNLFGMSVAVSADGNTLAVSAPWEPSAATGVNGNQNDTSMPQAGAAYVFVRSGESWSQQAYVKASNTGHPADLDDPTADGDQFGSSIALSGDGNTLAVGAITEDSVATGINGNAADDSANSAGAVYVYSRTGTSWAQQAYVKGSNTEAADLFGYDVALSHDGNTLVAAGYDEDGPGRGVNVADQGNGANGSGALYVFNRAGGAWKQDAYLKGSRSEGNDALGFSIAISADGNTIIGGAADESCLLGGISPQGCNTDKPEDASGGSAGAAYVWVRGNGTWTEQAFIKSSSPQLQDWFAANLALSADGNTLLVAAPMEDSRARGIDGDQKDDSAVESGAAYVFRRTGTSWAQLAYMKASNAEEYDEFGTAVAVTGDGRTLVTGARMESGGVAGVNGNENDNSMPQSGAVYVWEVSQ